jgi:hypothetical protein
MAHRYSEMVLGFGHIIEHCTCTSMSNVFKGTTAEIRRREYVTFKHVKLKQTTYLYLLTIDMTISPPYEK